MLTGFALNARGGPQGEDRAEFNTKPSATHDDPYGGVLKQVVECKEKAVESLVGHLLTAHGFDPSEVTGKAGDDRVDDTSEQNAGNPANEQVLVQAKRYKRGSKIAGPQCRN